MKVQHEIPQAEAIGEHISTHREKYLFCAGLIVGIACTRLVGRPQVVVINNIIEGATRG